MQRNKQYSGPISGDMHQAIVELAVLAGDLPQEQAAQMNQLLRGLFDATERVSGLEAVTTIEITPTLSAQLYQ